MSEDQHTEWKTSWRDEHLKWLCAFANAQGGVLEIGRDDKGQAVGLDNAERLMEELPNKLRNLLGMVPDVNLLEENGLPYVQIVVEAYPVPISYRGKYYYRSGSTRQALTGAALDRFLLGKTGKRWDAAPVPGVRVDDLNAESLTRFRNRAASRNRLGKDVLEEDNPGLMEKLRLTEGQYLKRAGSGSIFRFLKRTGTAWRPATDLPGHRRQPPRKEFWPYCAKTRKSPAKPWQIA